VAEAIIHVLSPAPDAATPVPQLVPNNPWKDSPLTPDSNRKPMISKLEKSIEALSNWIQSRHYKGYDPGDGQLSPLRYLTLNQHFARRLLTAAVLRAPFNIRPLIGTPPHTSTKGMGYFAWGYTKQYARTGDRRHLEPARHCLDWLIAHRSPNCKEYCWGNHFAFSTRSGTIPAHEPTIVWTSLIGQAFLEASRTFREDKYLHIASSICDWILTLPREQTASGTCLSYVAFTQSSIHNSNMLGAALLGQVGTLTGNQEALDTAREAMRYSCTRLNDDGSWYYGEAPKYHWIDIFHTGYNLDSLKRYIESTGDRSFEPQLRRGLDYFVRTFFEADGRPKYYHNKTYPTDIQCAAQAIDTLTFFSDQHTEVLTLAQKVAGWTIDHMQDSDGHFYYRDLGWTMNKTPMLHWGQGTMLKALAHLISKLNATTRASDAAALNAYAGEVT
jgi:hypothetical protein